MLNNGYVNLCFCCRHCVNICIALLGTPLSKLQLDPFTVTEILRLHVLSSGAKVSEEYNKFRYQQRGGYTSMDDPGLELRRSDPALVRALSTQNIFDLSPGKYFLQRFLWSWQVSHLF